MTDSSERAVRLTSSLEDIRAAERGDAAAITAIYNAGIEGRQATFETRLRDVAEIEAWFDDPAPFLVTERDGVVVGWARAGRYSSRPAYDGVAEHAVYVDPSARGERRGRLLLTALCEAAEKVGIFKLTSRVFTTNEASRAAHAAAGFLEIGTHPRHARLDGEWRDCVVVERLLGEAADAWPPELALVEAKTKVRLLHHDAFVSCLDLRDLVSSLTHWPGRAIDLDDRPHERMMAAIFARTFTTYSAAVELAGIGFGQQAAMLNRSLFEDMVDLHWITLEPATAVKRFAEHDLFGRMLLADAARAHYDDIEIPDFDPIERRRLGRIFGVHGHKPWSGIGIYDRVEAIRHMWGTKQPELIFYRQVIHRDNNQLLHLSAHAINSVISAETVEGLHVKIGPGPDHLDQALIATFWTFAQSLDLMIKAFDLPIRDRFEEIYLAGLGTAGEDERRR